MPKDFQKVIEMVNSLPISDSPLLTLRTESTKRPLEKDKAPDYIRSEELKHAMGTTVLSLFGGADVTPLLSSDVTSLVIVDANPFASKPNVLEHCTEEDCDGLFHKNMGLFILGYSPYLYATMDNHHDYDNPFTLVNHFRMRFGEYLDEPQYREKLNIPDNDNFYNFINENSGKALGNAWKAPGEPKDPVIDLENLGLATIILLRLRYCLPAKILEIEELKEDCFFRIKIKRTDGSEADLYYSSCIFGGSYDERATLHEVSSYIRDTLGGPTSILIRGFPDFFAGRVKGENQLVAQDVKNFVHQSKSIESENLNCVVCTNEGDKLPSFFTGQGGISKHTFPKERQYEKAEVVYTCNAAKLGLDYAISGKDRELGSPKP